MIYTDEHSATAQNLPNSEGWIYREDIKWVWTFERNFYTRWTMDGSNALSNTDYYIGTTVDIGRLANDFWWRK